MVPFWHVVRTCVARIHTGARPGFCPSCLSSASTSRKARSASTCLGRGNHRLKPGGRSWPTTHRRSRPPSRHFAALRSHLWRAVSLLSTLHRSDRDAPSALLRRRDGARATQDPAPQRHGSADSRVDRAAGRPGIPLGHGPPLPGVRIPRGADNRTMAERCYGGLTTHTPPESMHADIQRHMPGPPFPPHPAEGGGYDPS